MPDWRAALLAIFLLGGVPLPSAVTVFAEVSSGAARGAPPAASAEEGSEDDDAPSGEVVGTSGPLRVRDQFLLSVGYLTFAPAPLELLARGRWALGLSLSVANTFTRSDSTQVALEV